MLKWIQYLVKIQIKGKKCKRNYRDASEGRIMKSLIESQKITEDRKENQFSLDAMNEFNFRITEFIMLGLI